MRRGTDGRLWARVFLLLWILGAGAVALAFQQWVLAVVAGVIVVMALPANVADLRAAFREASAPPPQTRLRWRFSRAQQFAGGMAFVGGPLLAWRVIEDGWLAVVVICPLLAAWGVWMAVLIQREGWSGQKLNRG